MNTQIGYKLFEMDTNGNLYPLFIDKYTIYPIGEWIKAKNILDHNIACGSTFDVLQGKW